MAKEKTGPQVHVTSQDGTLPQTVKVATYKTFTEMRKDPTIKLGRAMVMAPVVSSMWAYESTPFAPEGAKEFIRNVMDPLRIHILKTAMAGHIDRGWAGYEKVFDLDRDGLVVIKKLKPLLQSMTEILVDEDTGAFVGLLQKDKNSNEVRLDVDSCLCITIDYEGTNWYGEALMTGAVDPYEKWNKLEEAASRYDRKVAGTHWVVYYPVGFTKLNGVEKDNFDIAKAILDACESSGKMCIPQDIERAIDDSGDKNKAWRIELLTDGSSGSSAFTERAAYLDKLKIRGLELPERSVIEGQFGTKAEAETHGDFAITNLELKHQVIVEVLNWHLVNQLLRLNWGPDAENSVFIIAPPIADMERVYIKSIYDKILSHPELGPEEMDKIDVDSMRERVGIPTRELADQNISEDQPPRLLDPNFKINMLPSGYSTGTD